MVEGFEARIKWIAQTATGLGHHQKIERNGTNRVDVPNAVSLFGGTERFARIAVTEPRLDNAALKAKISDNKAMQTKASIDRS